MKNLTSYLMFACVAVILSAVPASSSARMQDTTPPQVVITSPSENQTVSGTILLSASVSDPIVRRQKTSGIKAVRFFIDGTFYEIDKQTPYTAELDTTTLSDGLHALQVRARDNAGNLGKQRIWFTVLNDPPPPPPPPPPPLPPSNNLILNPSLESGTGLPNNWHQGQWGVNSAIFTYPVSGHTGNGAGINVSSHTDGDAKWYFDDVNIIPGEKYTFSDFYKSTVPTQITARYTNTDGSYLYLDFGYPSASADWKQFSYSFTAPQNTVSLTIFHLIKTVGSLSVDDFSLTKEISSTQPFSQGMVTFSFDDAWFSSYQNGIPILNSYGIKSTQYIISGALGWDDYITTGQMLDMQSQGHEIGAHSKTHPDLIALTTAQITDEVLGSKQDLEALGANTISSFAYPYGNWNENIKNIVKESGFAGARTAVIQDGGFNYANQDSYLLKTLSVEVDTPVSEVQQWINDAVQNKTWLILVYHQIENGGSQYSTTPQNLNSVAGYVSANNVKTVTIGQGLAELPQ